MERKHIRLIPIAIFILVFFFALATHLTREKETTVYGSPMIGKRVNFFDMPILIGNAERFTPYIWQGRVVLVNFFASWCVPCVQEHQVLMELAKTRRVEIYGIAWKDKKSTVLNWLRTRGNPYQMVGMDNWGKSSIAFGLIGVPETYILDSRGAVRFVYRSQLTKEVVDNEILPLIDKIRTEHVSPY